MFRRQRHELGAERTVKGQKKLRDKGGNIVTLIRSGERLSQGGGAFILGGREKKSGKQTEEESLKVTKRRSLREKHHLLKTGNQE